MMDETMDDKRVESMRIVDESGRSAALAVLGATYRNEKGWVSDPEDQFPVEDLQRHEIAWFIVRLEGARWGSCVHFSIMPSKACA